MSALTIGAVLGVMVSLLLYLLLAIADFRATRHYKVKCLWKGVFDRRSEYVWSPWADLYPDAEVDYTLELTFAAPPRKPPRLYRLAGAQSLQSVLRRFAEHDEGDIVSDGGTTDKRGRVTCRFCPELGRANFLCLFGK